MRMPACAEACPHEAIRIEAVSQSAVRLQFNGARPSSATAIFAAPGPGIVREPINAYRPGTPEDGRAPALAAQRPNLFLPGSPEPCITFPTTRYLSARPIP